MSDPVTNIEIEDVLSSIRRLVSADSRGKPDGSDANANDTRLVLTPALRVAGHADQPAKTADDAALEPKPETALSETDQPETQGKDTKAHSDAATGPMLLTDPQLQDQSMDDGAGRTAAPMLLTEPQLAPASEEEQQDPASASNADIPGDTDQALGNNVIDLVSSAVAPETIDTQDGSEEDQSGHVDLDAKDTDQDKTESFSASEDKDFYADPADISDDKIALFLENADGDSAAIESQHAPVEAEQSQKDIAQVVTDALDPGEAAGPFETLENAPAPATEISVESTLAEADIEVEARPNETGPSENTDLMSQDELPKSTIAPRDQELGDTEKSETLLEDAAPVEEPPQIETDNAASPSQELSLEDKIANLERLVEQSNGDWDSDQGEQSSISALFLRSSSAFDTGSTDRVHRPEPDAILSLPEPADDIISEAESDFDDDGDGAFLDEAALRDLVTEIVRQELQGVLGERVTRNVRKLVRREIQRFMIHQHFD